MGSLLVAGDDDALHYLSFPNSPNAVEPQSHWHQSDAPFLVVRRHLATIPFGETQTYGQLAATLERPKASRAVGGANGSNPLPIIRPCHRVIGGNGSLTGFGGGLPTKGYLLLHEGAYTQSMFKD